MKEQYKQFSRVAPCLLAIVVDYTGFGLVYPLVTAMFGKGGIFAGEPMHNFFLGLAYLLYPLGMFFGACLLGDFSDKWGRKNILIISLAGMVCSFLLMGVGVTFSSLSLFLVGRAVSGLFAGSQPLAQAAVADISTPDDKKWNMGLISLANNVGLIFGPLVAGIFTTQGFIRSAGYIYPFLISAAFALIALIWTVVSFKETYNDRPEKRIGWLRPIEIVIEAFKSEDIRPLASILFLFQVGVALFYQMIAVYLSRVYDYPSDLLGYFYGFMGLFFVLGITLVYPVMLRLFQLHTIVWIGFFSMSLCIFLSAAIPAQWAIWLFSALYAITNIFVWTGFLTYYSNHIDDHHQGWAMGIFTGMVALSFMLAGWATNLLPWISSRALVSIGAIISAVAGVFFLFYHLTTGRKKLQGE